MLVKNIFRKEIKQILLEHMVQGHIAPGVRISLPQLAKDLEVSVTPIREALTQLSEIGIVTYIPNRGFFVTELSKNEAVDIFETIIILECEAIKQSCYSNEHLSSLKSINKTFSSSKNALEKLQLDMQFHQKLIEPYKNHFIKKIIEDIRIRIFIYEHKFMNLNSNMDSALMHEALILALEQGHMTEATQLLKSNWTLSISTILGHYKS